MFASNPTGMPPAGPSISIPTKLLATGVACALVIVVCGTAATVVVASNVTNTLGAVGRTQLISGAHRAGTAPENSFRDTGATAAALDSLVAPLGTPMPVAKELVDSLAGLRADSSTHEISQAVTEVAAPAVPPDVLRRRMVLPFSLNGLSLPDLANLRQDAQDPSLPLFRRWARGPKQPNLWRYPTGLPDASDARDFPIRAFLPWRVFFAENESASLLALHDGNSAMALERARENVAGARHFAEQPVVIDALLGQIFLRRSLQVLAFVATSTGETITAMRARQLDSAAKNYAVMFSVKSLAAPESDADSRAAEEFAADRNIHPSLRVQSLAMITLGGCRSLPELVFGFSERRRDAMSRAVANIQDIDRGAELAARQQKFLDHALTLREPSTNNVAQTILGRNVILSAFPWIVPPGVRARAALCLELGL